MVLLSRIYTKGGDKGKTSLGDGTRVAKSSRRIDVIGTIDEANAAMGLCRLYTMEDTSPNHEHDVLLQTIQNTLFDMGADLCVPKGEGLRLSPDLVKHLETLMDQWTAHLAPLTSFILPGGSPLAAHLHMARTIVRRAERLACALFEEDPMLNPTIIHYLNRLSDTLFVLSRVVNAMGAKDVLWIPGGNPLSDH